MPLLAYQSFNANSSSTHDLKALSFQRFTKQTNAYVTGQGHQALVLPYDTGNLATPIEGPAQLVPIEALKGPQPVHAFGAQISLLWQNFNRVLGAMPDVMVCGEMDTSNPDFSNIISDSAMNIDSFPAKRACQSFSTISQSSIASQIKLLGSGEGYVAYSIGGIVAVFVHVPNSVAKSRHASEDFYNNIACSMLVIHKVIDIVIGDTNQGSFNYTREVLNRVFNTNLYWNASADAKFVKVDNFNVVEGGTNSNGTKSFDIAVYHSGLVTLKGHAAYVSQSSSGITVTDHCGIGVMVERKTG